MASTESNSNKFPPNFIFGAGTSAFQIEGAAFADGKGLSIWDTFTHQHPNPVKDGAKGEVACDSYELYTEDIKCLKQLNASHYRFSLSWPRLLPNGRSTHINNSAVEYYNRLIDELIIAGITPMITLYHWDLPQSLQDRGGWLNREIVQWFKDYAHFCFDTFGDRVRYWITINEPWVTAWFGHGDGKHAPGLVGQDDWAPYLVTYHQLLAHAAAYRDYDETFRAQQKGYIGAALNGLWCDPATSHPDDQAAARRAVQYELGLYSHPIFSKTGGWPEEVESLLKQRSHSQGRCVSKLPEFTSDEIAMLKGSADFFGLNYYHSSVCRATEPMPREYIDIETGKIVKKRNVEMNLRQWVPSDWPKPGGPDSWVTNTPEGLTKMLNFIRVEYDNPTVIVTENGCTDRSDGMHDHDRIQYIHDHLGAVLNAVHDGCNVGGYILWSLMDNFEWTDGYTSRFGLFHVDFRDRCRPRRARASVSYVAQVFDTNRIVDPPKRPNLTNLTRTGSPVPQ